HWQKGRSSERPFSVADLSAGSPQSTGKYVIHSRLDEQTVSFHPLRDHLAGAMNLGEHAPVRRRHENTREWPATPNRRRERASKRFQTAFGDTRDKYRRRRQRTNAFLQREERLVLEQIDLVEHEQG